jgi:hypothetical protein
MRTVATAILVFSIACNTSDDNEPYGDVRRAGDNAATGDSPAGDPLAGDPTTGGDTGLPVFTLNITDSCPAFTPCGGNEVGTWAVTDVCVEESVLFADLFTACAAAVVSDIPEAPASGVVTFTGTIVDRYATAAITADILIPNSCAFCQCTMFEGLLDKAGLDATCNATCNGNSECECTIHAELLIDESGAYTAAGNTITTNDGRTFDYCVTANQFQYVDTTMTDPEPGLYTMLRQ